MYIRNLIRDIDFDFASIAPAAKDISIGGWFLWFEVEGVNFANILSFKRLKRQFFTLLALPFWQPLGPLDKFLPDCLKMHGFLWGESIRWARWRAGGWWGLLRRQLVFYYYCWVVELRQWVSRGPRQNTTLFVFYLNVVEWASNFRASYFRTLNFRFSILWASNVRSSRIRISYFLLYYLIDSLLSILNIFENLWITNLGIFLWIRDFRSYRIGFICLYLVYCVALSFERSI